MSEFNRQRTKELIEKLTSGMRRLGGGQSFPGVLFGERPRIATWIPGRPTIEAG
ncbi:MAG: hypothetical protein NTV61_04860 [Candidatus Bathyarchaeota archaeon]|nr:hypothetical protein [Candidatus Bathyarchaeota archaeon]